MLIGRKIVKCNKMGTEASKPDFLRCATLNFQPSKEVAHSSVLNFDNVMLLIRALFSLIPVVGMIPQVTIPAQLLESKAAGDKLLLFIG